MGVEESAETVDLYRAVSAEELQSIKETGQFSLQDGFFEGKQFGLDLGETREFANNPFNEGLYSGIVKTSIPESVFSQLDSTIADAFNFHSGIVTATSDTLELINKSLTPIQFFPL